MFQHWPYLLILLAIALIVFGPRRLPELGEGLGKAIKEFRKATTEVTESVKDAVKEDSAPKSTGATYTPSSPGTIEQPPAPPQEAPKV